MSGKKGHIPHTTPIASVNVALEWYVLQETEESGYFLLSHADAFNVHRTVSLVATQTNSQASLFKAGYFINFEQKVNLIQGGLGIGVD